MCGVGVGGVGCWCVGGAPLPSPPITSSHPLSLISPLSLSPLSLSLSHLQQLHVLLQLLPQVVFQQSRQLRVVQGVRLLGGRLALESLLVQDDRPGGAVVEAAEAVAGADGPGDGVGLEAELLFCFGLVGVCLVCCWVGWSCWVVGLSLCVCVLGWSNPQTPAPPPTPVSVKPRNLTHTHASNVNTRIKTCCLRARAQRTFCSCSMISNPLSAGRSILFTTQKNGSPFILATANSFRVCSSIPLAASTSMTALSATASVR